MTEYRIATSVLEDIVRGAVVADERVRVHSALPLIRTHPVEVLVEAGACDVAVHLDARLGEALPKVASDVRAAVAEALNRMTGLTVRSVDVVFAAVFPAGS
ncbi:MAG: Asp23/Gls24 family envelope stress response protein [Actinobacteria bacterium]|nr:Asp23/Gls24 family envelope stress response protein [Actinomycetota bacterium]